MSNPSSSKSRSLGYYKIFLFIINNTGFEREQSRQIIFERILSWSIPGMFSLIRTVNSEKIKITTTKTNKQKINDDRPGQTLSDGKNSHGLCL